MICTHHQILLGW